MPYFYSWVALLGLLATAGAARAQPAAFAAATTFSVGSLSYPAGIVVADVNGDNKPDLLTANYNSSTAGVLLGTGTGSFSPVTTFSTGGKADGIAVADVSGDGKPDIVTANYSNSTAGVLLGTGTGGFGAVTTFSTGAGSTPATIAVADVNGDGKPDIVTANIGTNTAGVLLGTGTGSFGAVTTFSTGSGSRPRSIVVADVNGDGQPDLLTTNGGNDTVGVLLGTGAGSFGAVTTFSTGAGSGPYGLAVADVNGDGKPDIATANTNNDTVAVLLNVGLGSFGPVTTFTTGTLPRSIPGGIVVADVNGDGKPDLLTANGGNQTAGVLLGTGTGSFGSITTFGTGGSTPSSLAVADVNGDRRPDLLMANYNSDGAGVLLNAGTYAPLATTTSLAAEAVQLYPNPAHGRVQVAVPAVAGATAVQATLLDALGRVVRRQTTALPATGTTLTLDAAGLAAGVYTLRLQAGAAVLARRVVLE